MMVDLEKVANDELITRFIREEDHISAKGTPKPGAFRPNPNKGNTTSVFRVSSVSSDKIWTIGKEVVERGWIDGKKIIARTNLLTGDVISKGLQVVPAPATH